jgi:fibronectin type 3 domain-containing protein
VSALGGGGPAIRLTVSGRSALPTFGVVTAVAALTLVLTPLSVMSAPTPAHAVDAPTCTVSPILVNSCRPWLGATVKNYTEAAGDTLSQVNYHEQRIGRTLDIVHTYHPVGTNTLTSSDVHFATRPGTMLFANWKPTNNWASIASQNAGIDQMAASIKALGPHRIFLTLHHEPERDVSPGGDPNCPALTYKGTFGTAADYRAMWAYVENRFAADGVTNVVWALDYQNYAPWDCLVPDLYPGDKLVDWVVFNGYDNNAKATFSSVVSRFYNLLGADTDSTHSFTSKPWGIVEWGSRGFTAAQESAYYDSAKAALDTNAFPNLKAYMVFDENDQGSATGDNFRVAYDDNGAFDQTKANHYYSFADDPLLAGSYQDPVPPPDITPPSVSLSAPVDQSAVAGSVPVSGTATDDRAVAEVDLLVDGADSGVSVSQPANSAVGLAWDSTTVPDGSHSLQLQAVDTAGNVARSAIATVDVDNAATTPVPSPTPDVDPPTAPSLTALAANGPSEADLAWEGATDNVGVTGYQIFRDGVLLATVGDVTSYEDATVEPDGTYSYDVVAKDAAGNLSEGSNSMTLTLPPMPASDVSPPSVPDVVTATPVSAAEVDVTWHASTDNVGVTGYHVYRDGSLVATLGRVTSYADTGLQDATTYSYTVDAVDAAGNVSDRSVAASTATADATAPTVPDTLTAVVNGPRQVQLSWHASTDNVGVAGYDVYRDTSLVAKVTAGTSYLDSPAGDGATYSYRVAAYDAAGNVSALSTAVSATTPDATPPSVPSGVTATATGPHQIRLGWAPATDNVGVASYAIYRAGVKIAVASGTSYLDTTVKDATTYAYNVTAVDSAGNTSGQSLAATASTPDGTAPSVPTTPKATSTAFNLVTVSWTAATDNVAVTGYRLYRNGALLTTLGNVTSYQDRAVAGRSLYTYNVVALDAAGNASAQTPSVSVTTPAAPDLTPPSVPLNLKAALTATGSVRLTWSTSSDNVGVTGYAIYRNGVALTTVTAASKTDTTVKQGTAYSYAVAAFDAAGNTSARTALVSITVPDTTPPSVPANLKLTAGSKSVALAWSASTDNVGVKGYFVFRNAVNIATVTVGTTYTNKALVTGTKYSYRLVAFDAAGNSSAATATQTIAAK